MSRERVHIVLLVSVHWIDENGSAVLNRNKLLEHQGVETGHGRRRDEDVQPRVRHVPQLLCTQAQLHIVDSVQKLEVEDVRAEQQRPDEAQRSQHLLNSLQAPPKEQQLKTKLRIIKFQVSTIRSLTIMLLQVFFFFFSDYRRRSRRAKADELGSTGCCSGVFTFSRAGPTSTRL